jgi:hypothetical protein
MAFLSELNSEDCGCDNNYLPVINESPLLSGSQENNFDPANNSNNVLNYNNSNNSNSTNTNNANNLNNNVNNNMLHNNNNKMNNINNSELQQILGNNNMQNNMQNNNMQNNMQNNNQMSEQQIQNILNSIPNTNKRNSTQLPDIGSMRNNNEQVEITNQLNHAVNANAVALNDGNTQTKYISTMFNYVIVLLVALALNDLAKYYINRSIKFQNGTHMYYVYYSIGLVIVLYIVSKYTNNL